MPINNNILNQKGTPAFYSDIFANRPAFGYAGRVFISTDTGAIYEDTGSAWTLIADAGAGTTGTLQQVTTNGNTTTLAIQVQGIDFSDGAGTGLYNIAIGNQTMGANTTGNSNIAIGYQNLKFNTTGALNVAVGNTALVNNTTGSQNTAVGMLSLNLNTTGGQNTALGNATLQNNTTGANNTALGSGVLTLNTTGISNTAIGQSSLGANVIGSYNVALGVGSLSNNTASYNVGIGHSSLNAVTTGTNNSAIGYASGSAITTGSNNTIIGNYAGTTTLASNIVLSDGAGNVRLFSDANGLIGINQAVGSTIGGQLDIHSTQTYALVLNGLSTSNAYTAFSNASVGKWRIGNTYNAGANTFDIFNLGTSSNALSINSTSNVVTLNSYPLIDGGSVLIKLGSNTSTSGYTGIGAVATGLTINLGAAGTTGSLLFNTGASYSYTFPAATGTLALTSNLSSYLPLAGGTLTGTLNGTSASFSSTLNTGGDITANDTTIGDTFLYLKGNASTGSVGVRFARASTGAQMGKIDYTFGTDTMTFRSGGNDRMYLFSDGNLSIGSGTNDTVNKLQVTGSATFSSSVTINQSGYTFGAGLNLLNWQFVQGADNGLYLAYSGSQKLSIASTGAATFSNLAGTGSRAVLADANGLLSAPVSDISVKTNIKSIGYGLSDILKMNPVWFEYIDEYKSMGNGRQNGNIAQEMESIIPEAVFTTPSTGKMGINYDQLHAVYIKAIQELKAEIDALKNN